MQRKKIWEDTRMGNKFLSEYNGVVTSDGRILEGSVRNVFDPDLGLVIIERNILFMRSLLIVK